MKQDRAGASHQRSVTTRARRIVRLAGRSESAITAYLRLRRTLGRKGEYVFVACMPKSGSTFLTQTLSRITGFPHAPLTYAFERNEQQLYLPKLVDTYTTPTVTQQHVRATGPNLELFNRFGIRPVVLVRNLFDAIVSIRDYLEREGVERFPSLYATDHFLSLPETRQYDFLITFAAPWYFNFYASWFDASRNGVVPTLWLTYEELAADLEAGVDTVLRYYGLARSKDEIAAAVAEMHGDPGRVRLNKGVAGRGATMLTASQKDRLVEMASFYPWIDFGPIGLA